VFTVIVADKAFVQEADGYALFLEPFRDPKTKTFAICEWNPKGLTLREMIPDLYKTVGSNADWRVIIIPPGDNFDIYKINPFDIAGYRDVKQVQIQPGFSNREIFLSGLEEKTKNRKEAYKTALEAPVVRLGILLGGSPVPSYSEMPTSELQKSVDTAIQKLDNSTADTDRAGSIADLRADLEYLHYAIENDYKRELISEFFDPQDPEKHLLLPAPKEIYYLSLRTYDNRVYETVLSAENSLDIEYSPFASVNVYPAQARFIVFDIRERGHSQFDYDFVCFLEFLFSFATNEMPASKMRSEILYRAVCDNNFNLLCRFLNRYEKKLNITETILKKRYRELTDETFEEISDASVQNRYCSDIVITPVPPPFEPGDFGLNSKTYGVFGKAEDDVGKLRGIGSAVREKLKAYEKKAVRASSVLSESVRNERTEFEAPSAKLTAMQAGDISEFVDQRETVLARQARKTAIESGRLERDLTKEEKQIRSKLQRRMSAGKFVFAIVYIVVSLLLSYAAFFSSVKSAAVNRLLSLGMFILSAAIVLLTAIIILVRRYRRLKMQLESYKYVINRYVDECRGLVVHHATLLSRILEVMRGNFVISHNAENRSHRLSKAYVIEKHICDIADARAKAADIFGKFNTGFTDAENEADIDPYDYDFSLPYTYSYELPFNESDIRKIKFMGSSFTGEIPIGFISEIDVVREEVS